MQLPQQVESQIRAHCELAYPYEAVGAIFGSQNQAKKAVQATNIAVRADRFEVTPEETLKILLAAESEGFEVIGWYHSHPDHPPAPSAHDVPLLDQGLLMLIVSVQNGKSAELRCWRLEGGETTEEKVEN